jgi:hypothetical protein
MPTFLIERRMSIRWCSPHALLFLLLSFFPQLPTLLSMPLSPPTALGEVCFLTRIMQKQATHGTQSMGFEAIQQRKSRCIFFPCFSVFVRGYASAYSSFRVFPCSSVANLLLLFGLPSVAQSNSCKFHLFRFSAIQILEPTCFPCKNLLLIVGITILIRSLK